MKSDFTGGLRMKARNILLAGSLFLSLSAFAHEPDLVCNDHLGNPVIHGRYIRECGDIHAFHLENGRFNSDLKNTSDVEYSIAVDTKSEIRLRIYTAEADYYTKNNLSAPQQRVEFRLRKSDMNMGSDRTEFSGMYDIGGKTKGLKCTMDTETFSYISKFSESSRN
jgi:hypothetical protein